MSPLAKVRSRLRPTVLAHGDHRRHRAVGTLGPERDGVGGHLDEAYIASQVLLRLNYRAQC